MIVAEGLPSRRARVQRVVGLRELTSIAWGHSRINMYAGGYEINSKGQLV
jgi:hypothetical protein